MDLNTLTDMAIIVFPSEIRFLYLKIHRHLPIQLLISNAIMSIILNRCGGGFFFFKPEIRFLYLKIERDLLIQLLFSHTMLTTVHIRIYSSIPPPDVLNGISTRDCAGKGKNAL